MSMPLLSIKDLSVEFGSPHNPLRVVDSVGFEIEMGGAVGLALVMTLVDSRIGDAAPVQLAGETSASGYRLGFAATAGLPNAATAVGRGAITTTSHPPAPRRCSALSLFAPRD